MANDARAILIEGSVRRHLINLTVPMVWGLLALMSFNVADTWFVAQLGTEELAAMSFTFPVVNVLTAIGIGIMAGTSSVLARVLGAQDQQRLRRLTSDALLLALVVSVVLAAVGIATIEPLFLALGANETLLPMIRDYMRVWYVSIVFLFVPMAALGAIRATGDAKTQGNILIASALLNLALDPIFIFGLFGVPRLELEGAAVATLIARIGLLGAGLFVLHVRKEMLSFVMPRVDEVLASWRQVLHIALPAAGTNLIIPLSAGFVTAMLAGYGSDAVAGFGAATRIEALSLIVFYAMSGMIGPFVGQNLGAKRYDRIEEAMRDSARFCIYFGIALAIALGLSAPFLARLFTDSESVVGVSVTYLLLVPVSYGAAGVVMLVNAAFNGLGTPTPAVVSSLCRAFILYVPLAYFASKIFGINGIFFAACLSNILIAVAIYAYFKRSLDKLKT